MLTAVTGEFSSWLIKNSGTWLIKKQFDLMNKAYSIKNGNHSCHDIIAHVMLKFIPNLNFHQQHPWKVPNISLSSCYHLTIILLSFCEHQKLNRLFRQLWFYLKYHFLQGTTWLKKESMNSRRRCLIKWITFLWNTK